MKYFLHDTNSFDDEKITELFINFGYEGLGLFYTILEKIAKQEKPVKTTVLKAQLKVGKRLEKCWSFMEQIGLICSINGETFNEKLLNYSEKYQIKKQKNKEKISQWRKNQVITENVIGYEPECNAPKVKESKVNRSKIKGSKVKESKVKEEEEENSLPTKLSAAKENDFIDQIVTQFAEAHGSYEVLNKGKERKAAGILLSHYKKKFPAAGAEETLKGLRAYFEKCLQINDSWMNKNMSLPLIVSKFNEINKTLKNGQSKHGGGTPPGFKEEILSRLQSDLSDYNARRGKYGS